MNKTEYLKEIKSEYQRNANAEKAVQMAAYMKNKFDFYGINSPLRKEISRPFLIKNHLPTKNETFEIVEYLWKEEQRELHYFAIELLLKYTKQFEVQDIKLLEKLIIENAWWDSVDAIASNLVGKYFIKFPHQKEKILPKWIKSKNLWLNRSAIIFQLKYKENTDEFWLTESILPHMNSSEFFHKKAIGWALREYGKTNPNFTINFVKKQSKNLSNLSIREALKHLG